MDQTATDPAGAAAPRPPYETVTLSTVEPVLASFFPLLQRGVTVPAAVGCSLREFLCGQLGIPEQYVTGRITTIFLDNHPLDNLDCLIGAQARLTLSAAMPGLVGAVLRRSSFYAALRAGITQAESAGKLDGGNGTVTLKLFNLLLPELGPLVLARGILLDRTEVHQVLGSLPAPCTASYPSDSDTGSVLLRVSFGAYPRTGTPGTRAVPVVAASLT